MTKHANSTKFPAEQYPYQIKDWWRFQHYKKRFGPPPWIRLYRTLLSDIEWHQLDPVASKLLVNLWMLAANHEGYLPASNVLAFRLHLTSDEILSILPRLSLWVETRASAVLAPCYQNAMPDTDTDADSDADSERKTDAAVPAAEADNPLDSAEDKFWKLVPKLSAGGIAKSRCCQLLKLSDNDFEAVNRILADVLKAHVPSQYLGKIIANLKQERQLEVPMAHDPTLPDFAQGFKRDGYRIEYLRENRWKIGAEIYNEKGEVVGW